MGHSLLCIQNNPEHNLGRTSTRTTYFPRTLQSLPNVSVKVVSRLGLREA